MNKFWILTIVLSTVLFSCSNGESQGSENDEVAATDLGAGPNIEMSVLSFDADAHKTQVEIINRMDEAINNISGRLVFINEDGSPLTRANGDPITSPFQNMSNPHVVDAKSKKTIVLGNSIQTGTASIDLSELKVTTTSGKEISVE